MTKQLDKMTKAELLAVAIAEGTARHNLEVENTQLRNDAAMLEARLAQEIRAIYQVRRERDELIEPNIDEITAPLQSHILYLEDKIAKLEDRRKFENQAYRAKIKKTDNPAPKPSLNQAALYHAFVAEHGNVRVTGAMLKEYGAAKGLS